MNIADIVGQLRSERNRLDAAIQALEGIGEKVPSPGKRRGQTCRKRKNTDSGCGAGKTT